LRTRPLQSGPDPEHGLVLPHLKHPPSPRPCKDLEIAAAVDDMGFRDLGPTMSGYKIPVAAIVQDHTPAPPGHLLANPIG
jgi:hypothetical protein